MAVFHPGRNGKVCQSTVVPFTFIGTGPQRPELTWSHQHPHHKLSLKNSALFSKIVFAIAEEKWNFQRCEMCFRAGASGALTSQKKPPDYVRGSDSGILRNAVSLVRGAPQETTAGRSPLVMTHTRDTGFAWAARPSSAHTLTEAVREGDSTPVFQQQVSKHRRSIHYPQATRCERNVKSGLPHWRWDLKFINWSSSFISRA